MKMVKTAKISLYAILLMASSCRLEEPVIMPIDAIPIEFVSSKASIITKAGEKDLRFEDGTKFRLFAVATSDGMHNWSNVVVYDREGIETSGRIAYGEKVSYGVAPLNVLDFYGVTYGNSDDVEVTGSIGTAPEVSIEAGADGLMPDLMYSDNLMAKSSSSGLLNMEYHHAMARLNFEIIKQDETTDNVKELENAVLEKIILKGTGINGIFDIETGNWKDMTVKDRVIYDGSFPIKESAQQLTSTLVIPTDGDVALQIFIGGIENGKESVEHTLSIDEENRLQLKQNHEYTISIAVLKNDVRIVAVTPKVYDWIDVELKPEDAYFGQPVYFGDLMWMDRNLGAKSADCENDWYNTIGYYYQHGRNIPYHLDVEIWKKHFNTSSKVSFSGNEFNHGLFYTLDQHGNKTSVYLPATGASAPASDLPYYDDVAKNPGDEGDYSFICGFHSWSSWARGNDNGADKRNDVFWDDVENHPCPKGWRLPTRKDMYKYLPEEYNNIAKWQNSYTHGRSITKDYHAGNRNSLGEEYQWKYFTAMFKVDQSASGEWSYPVKDDFSRVYLIKYEGTGRAYRIMIEQKKANTGDDGPIVKKYVRVSRFDTKHDDKFLMSPDKTQWNLHKFDWENPAEYMDFPLCGYIDSGDGTNSVISYHPYLGAFGNGCILRSQEIDTSGALGRNWTMYFMDTFRGVTVGGGSRRSLGDQIRCVRDINA